MTLAQDPTRWASRHRASSYVTNIIASEEFRQELSGILQADPNRRYGKGTVTVKTFLQPTIGIVDQYSPLDAPIGYDWREAARTWQRKAEQVERLVKVGSFEVDLETDALTWSEGTYAIFGLTPGLPVTVEQALGFYDDDVQVEIGRHLEAAAASGEPYDLTVPFRSAAGGTGWARGCSRKSIRPADRGASSASSRTSRASERRKND